MRQRNLCNSVLFKLQRKQNVEWTWLITTSIEFERMTREWKIISQLKSNRAIKWICFTLNLNKTIKKSSNFNSFFISWSMQNRTKKDKAKTTSFTFILNYLLRNGCGRSKCRRCSWRQSKSICMKARTVAVHQDHRGWKVKSARCKNSVWRFAVERFASQQTCRIIIITWRWRRKKNRKVEQKENKFMKTIKTMRLRRREQGNLIKCESWCFMMACKLR